MLETIKRILAMAGKYRHKITICLKFRPLLIRKALRNMAEAECTLPHRLTMTR